MSLLILYRKDMVMSAIFNKISKKCNLINTRYKMMVKIILLNLYKMQQYKFDTKTFLNSFILKLKKRYINKKNFKIEYYDENGYYNDQEEDD